MIIETIPLEQVNDFELVDNIWLSVLYLEVVPLSVSVCVEVCLQHQLILKLTSVQSWTVPAPSAQAA